MTGGRPQPFARCGPGVAFIGPGNPWQSDDLESSSAEFRTELLSLYFIHQLSQTRELVERWKHSYTMFGLPSISAADLRQRRLLSRSKHRE
jgi:hypothetical protein